MVWRWDNVDPFGANAANDDPDGDGTAFVYNKRFAGQYNDSETGLHYNYHRYYSPETGRYITSDPIGLAGGLNTYGYVGGNPVNWFDPYGMFGVSDLPTFSEMFGQSSVDAIAGFGDTLSFGATDMIRDGMGTNNLVNKCSNAYSNGEWAGIGLGLAFGGASLGRNAVAQMGKRGSMGNRLNRGLGRLLSDGRTWGSVRSTWSGAMGGLANRGQHLHHWLIPQRWGAWNAGLNYMPISAGFNSWMNGSTFMRRAVERGFSVLSVGLLAAPITGTVNKSSSDCSCN